MTDPMQLLTAANPVTECPAPDFDRLLQRLEHEPSEAGSALPAPPRGGCVLLRRTHLRRVASGRRALVAIVPVMVAVAVAAVAIVSLHAGAHRRTGPAQISGSLAYPPGQARGRVVAGSMHQFTVSTIGAAEESWSAGWFRTTAGQICVQAGREVNGRLGYVGIDPLHPGNGRFRPWAPNSAVEARCAQQPAHGGLALTVVDRVTDGGYELPASGACTDAGTTPCPGWETSTLFFGVVGSSASTVEYGTAHDLIQSIPAGQGPGGEYVGVFPGGGNSICTLHGRCTSPDHLHQLVHPGAHATVLFDQSARSCGLNGPGTRGVLAGPCPYGLTVGPSRFRLTADEVHAHLSVATTRKGDQIAVSARFRTRLPSSRLSQYELQLSTPTRCPPSAGGTSGSLPLGPGFHAGQILTIHGTVSTPCSGTYTGSVIVQPLVGSPITVGRFSFKAPAARPTG